MGRATVGRWALLPVLPLLLVSMKTRKFMREAEQKLGASTDGSLVLDGQEWPSSGYPRGGRRGPSPVALKSRRGGMPGMT